MIAADLHLHSCLSPCGDDAMNPCDLVGMSALGGTRLVALTDHNTARNCPAAAAAAAAYGIGFIPGMEVTTSEDIHMICLFPSLEAALDFDRVIYARMPDLQNRPEVFGNQLVCAPDGRVVGTEPRLLITACDISALELPGIAAGYGAVCYPAHVDREGNGLLAILGSWPPELNVPAAEIHQTLPPGVPEGLAVIRASDAHRLEDLPERGFPLPLDTPDFSGLRRWLDQKRH